MEEKELINTYKSSYKKQYDELFEVFDKTYSKANDKLYATEMILGIFSVMYAFTNVSELDHKIIELYNHSHKLGGNIIDVINAVPDTINSYLREKELTNEDKKKETKTSIKYKRFLGIPYKIENIKIETTAEFSSNFESLNEKNEIAEYLGKQRAIIDLVEFAKQKYIENGGLNELTKKENILPVKYKTLNNLKDCLSKNDLVEFFKILQSVFATLSYDMKITEGYFHSHIHLILTLLDFNIISEIETNQGRIDAVIEHKNYIHIIEFKQNSSKIALEQIINKKYYQKYLSKNKKIILVGVAVDKNERNIIDWKMKTIN